MSTHETDHRANEGEIKEVHRDVAEEYRAICDERCVGSRLVGIMDPTLVREALADLTTVSIEVDGATVPGFVDIAYSEGAGYVPERCRRITGDAQGALLYYAAPPLTSAEVTRTPTFDLPESGHIFFDHNSSDTLRFQACIC